MHVMANFDGGHSVARVRLASHLLSRSQHARREMVAIEKVEAPIVLTLKTQQTWSGQQCVSSTNSKAHPSRAAKRIVRKHKHTKDIRQDTADDSNIADDGPFEFRVRGKHNMDAASSQVTR